LAGITEQGKIGEEKMDKQFQRKGEKLNTKIGKEFEEKTEVYIHNLWKNIVYELSKTREIPTVRLRATEVIWFSAHSINDNVIITESKIRKPTSKLSDPRKISEKEFSEVYPYHQPWKKGKIKRKSMSGLSLNTSYILALINHFEKDNNGGSK
jgi:hypothetical protein